jgi:hypothetical protein
MGDMSSTDITDTKGEKDANRDWLMPSVAYRYSAYGQLDESVIGLMYLLTTTCSYLIILYLPLMHKSKIERFQKWHVNVEP